MMSLGMLDSSGVPSTICVKLMLCSAKTLVLGHGKILLNAPKGSEQISSEPFGAIKYNVSKPS